MPNYWFDLLIRDHHGCSNYGMNFTRGNLLYKKLGFNLRYIRKHSMEIYSKNFSKIFKETNRKRTKHIFDSIDGKFSIGQELQKLENRNRTFLSVIGTIRSKRYLFGLPCNGQHTQTNAINAEIHRYNFLKIKSVKRLNASDLKRRTEKPFEKYNYLKYFKKILKSPPNIKFKGPNSKCLKKR